MGVVFGCELRRFSYLLNFKRENQLYALQSKLRKVYAEEVNRRHHSGRSKKKR